MNQKWFLSDTHYAHTNMCYGVSSWLDKEKTTRKFNTLGEMNTAIVNSINKYVQQNDELYFLGDWSFGGIENIFLFYDRIICKNIYFIPGNHDHHIKKDKLLPNCKFGHHYDDVVPCFDKSENDVLAKQLFKMLPELITLVFEGHKIICSHYPLDQWEDMDKGSIMLHGHCHHNIDSCETNTKYRRMDVGIDWKEFRPYSLDEILKIMDKRQIKKHHN